MNKINLSPNNVDVSQSPSPNLSSQCHKHAEPIWELAARLSAQIPAAEWEKLPTDLARNFDNYQK